MTDLKRELRREFEKTLRQHEQLVATSLMRDLLFGFERSFTMHLAAYLAATKGIAIMWAQAQTVDWGKW